MPEDRDGRIGKNLIQMAVGSRYWIPRRAEEMELLDYSRARRTVRLDIDLSLVKSKGGGSGVGSSEDWPRWRDDSIIVPLAMVERGERKPTFEVCDESGSLLPRLTKEEERRLLARGLCLIAESKLKSYGPSHGAAIERFIVDDDAGFAGSAVGRELNADPSLAQMLQFFSRFYVLSTLVGTAVDRRVLRYSNIEFVPRRGVLPSVSKRATSRRDGLRLWARYPWDYFQAQNRLLVELDAPSAGRCRSYHLEASAPYDTRFGWAALFPVGGRDEAPLPPAVDNDRLDTGAHVYLFSPDRRITACRFEGELHLVHGGIPRAAFFSGMLTTAVLLIGLLYILTHDWSVDGVASEPAVTVLLLVPAVIGSLFATPSTHELTARMIFATRLLLALVSITPVLAAAPVVVQWSGAGLTGPWGFATLGAAVGTLALGRQWAYLRRRVRSDEVGQIP